MIAAKQGVFLGALERIRTFDLPLRRRTLYPLSYEGVLGFGSRFLGKRIISSWERKRA